MIKNLLFDLGGVIMSLDRQRCVETFRSLGLENPDSYFGEYSQKGPFMALERGDISVDEFHREMHKVLPPDVTDRQIDAAFLDFLVGIPAARLEALRKLRDSYGVFLLSNTNALMWNSKIRDEFGGDPGQYFDGMVTSFEARALKPDPEIFRYTARSLGIKPEETLFLDDSERNTRAAEALGFQTATVAPGIEFTEILRSRGIE